MVVAEPIDVVGDSAVALVVVVLGTATGSAMRTTLGLSIGPIRVASGSNSGSTRRVRSFGWTPAAPVQAPARSTSPTMNAVRRISEHYLWPGGPAFGSPRTRVSSDAVGEPVDLAVEPGETALCLDGLAPEVEGNGSRVVL